MKLVPSSQLDDKCLFDGSYLSEDPLKNEQYFSKKNQAIPNFRYRQSWQNAITWKRSSESETLETNKSPTAHRSLVFWNDWLRISHNLGRSIWSQTAEQRPERTRHKRLLQNSQIGMKKINLQQSVQKFQHLTVSLALKAKEILFPQSASIVATDLTTQVHT